MANKNTQRNDTMTITFKPLTVPTLGFSDEVEKLLKRKSAAAAEEMSELISDIAEREGWWPDIAEVTLQRGGVQASGPRVGDWFDPAGYEQVASVQGTGESDPGTYLLMHNHSTHYLLAVKPAEGRGGPADSAQLVRLMRTFDYLQRDWSEAYKDGLRSLMLSATSEE